MSAAAVAVNFSAGRGVALLKQAAFTAESAGEIILQESVNLAKLWIGVGVSSFLAHNVVVDIILSD